MKKITDEEASPKPTKKQNRKNWSKAVKELSAIGAVADIIHQMNGADQDASFMSESPADFESVV